MDERVKAVLAGKKYVYVPKTGEIIGSRGKPLKLQRRGNYLAFGVQIGTYKQSAVRMVAVHQYAFFFMEGEWPALTIDHINRNPHDNRWENLRKATYRQQQMNRKANGFTIRTKRYKKLRYEVSCDHKYVGVFDTEVEAQAAYQKALEIARK